MNYFLDDLKVILENQGFDNIKIDMQITSDNQTALGESILLFSEGGSKKPNLPLEEFDFAIYVRRGDPQQARIVSYQIFNYLEGIQTGLTASGSVSIIRILVRQKPMLFPTSGITEWLTTYTAILHNTDNLTLK